MTGCTRYRHELGAYVLDGLGQAESQEVQDHLPGCAGCRAEHGELVALPALLALARAAPPGVPERVRDRVVGAAARRRTRRRWAAAAVAAGLLAAVVGGFVGWQLAPAASPEVAVPLEAVEPFEAAGWAAFRADGDDLRVRLELSGLEPRTAPEVYEAWLYTADRRIVSIGQLEEDPGVLEATAQGPLSGYRGVWVTAEPDGRDPAHAGPTVLRARIPR